MSPLPAPTLAISGELIWGLIGVAFVLITWGYGKFKEFQQEEALRRRRQEQSMRPGSLAPERPEVLAAQRREELRRMAMEARMRAQRGPAAPARPGGPPPIALEAAPAELEARARQARELRAQAARREQAAREAEARRAQGVSAARRRAAEAAERARRGGQRAAPQPLRQQPMTPRRPAAEEVPILLEAEAVPAPVPLSARLGAEPAALAATAAAGGRRPRLAVSRHSLRDAFILKELLDRPLALREPGEPGQT